MDTNGMDAKAVNELRRDETATCGNCDFGCESILDKSEVMCRWFTEKTEKKNWCWRHPKNDLLAADYLSHAQEEIRKNDPGRDNEIYITSAVTPIEAQRICNKPTDYFGYTPKKQLQQQTLLDSIVEKHNKAGQLIQELSKSLKQQWKKHTN